MPDPYVMLWQGERVGMPGPYMIRRGEACLALSGSDYNLIGLIPQISSAYS